MKLLKMIIDTLKTFHIDNILPIEKTCYPDPWNYEHFLYEVHNQHSKSFVSLSQNSQLQGYLITHQIFDQIFILNLAVGFNFRKQGIATGLLHFLFDFAKINCVVTIDLEVRKSNANALSLYRKERFDITGERKKFYADGETAIIMCKKM
jgi:ribosomal-protein-alanine N-acetyltransferase